MKQVYLALLCCFGVIACAALTADRQSAVDEIAKIREQYTQEIKSLQSEWAESKSEEAALVSEIEKSNGQMKEALAESLYNVRATLASIESRQDQFAQSSDDLYSREQKIRAEDAGEKTGALMEIALALLGGGAASGAIHKFTPSRAAKEVEKAMSEVSAMKAALDAYRAEGGAVREDVGKVSNKLSRLEGVMDSFKEGLERRGSV